MLTIKNKAKILLNQNSSLFNILFFIIVSSIISILIMDILVMPVTVFAVEKTVLFNYILKNVVIATIAVLLLWSIIGKSLQMKKSGYSVFKILITLLLKPFKILGVVICFIILLGITISTLYLFFSLNNSFLYKIMSN
jgi:hypothetical protein